MSAGGAGDLTQFIWQQLSEIQRTLGAIEQQGKSNADKLGELDGKLEELKKQSDSHGTWIKSVTASVTAVGLVVGGLAAWVFTEVWSVAKPALLEKLNSQPAVIQPAGAQPAAPVPPAKK
jgi:hypothetical protein